MFCNKIKCYGHATECYYNPEVAEKMLSINSLGIVSGGGVCLNCTVSTFSVIFFTFIPFKYRFQNLTTGINCEKCIDWYYRPDGVPPDAQSPCMPCECNAAGSHGCNPIGGECLCRKGFTGRTCSECESFYEGEMCKKCLCDTRGTMPGGECESDCQCRVRHGENK